MDDLERSVAISRPDDLSRKSAVVCSPFGSSAAVAAVAAIAHGIFPLIPPPSLPPTMRHNLPSPAILQTQFKSNINRVAVSRPTSFSIDDILGRKLREDHHTQTSSSSARSSLEVTTCHVQCSAAKTVDDDEDDDNLLDEDTSHYSWLQCTRYKPPKLPRSKKKETGKKRKLGRNPRVPFTQHQVKVLEEKFRQTHYLSSVDVAELSAALSLTETRVKIWFQNRRARERRDRESLQQQQTTPLKTGALVTTTKQAKSAERIPTFTDYGMLTGQHSPDKYTTRQLVANWPKPVTPEDSVLAHFSSAYYSCSSAFRPVSFYGYC